MLKLVDIQKSYKTGAENVAALKGISVSFRKCEFVSILGPSGCGKTTLLNLIGGLDRYDSGDIQIKGKSTKKYKDRDWDAYRNNTIGFVFQSYNLISHQTVLSNVELSLTLTGVSKAERRKRAIQVLEKVGLGDQMYKKPAQMSGGQMQRVAIARALINDPEILLADEPTGALDSETGVQVMELLNEIARDRLVIMVTHNPELAQQYSTRIIRLLDGRIVDDTNPCTEDETELPKEAKRTSMSMLTALSLSLNNLMTKKARTILTAFASSIGIIGIALILALSTGVRNYIDQIEKETLASYPITLSSEMMDMTGLMEVISNQSEEQAHPHEEGYIYPGKITYKLLSSMMSEVEENDLTSFKHFIEEDETLKSLSSAVSYTYMLNMQLWSEVDGKPFQVNPSTTMNSIMEGVARNSTSPYMSMFSSYSAMNETSGNMTRMNVFTELLNNQELLDGQYQVLAGRWPQNKNEMVLMVTSNHMISDYALYSLGILPQSDLEKVYARGEEAEEPLNDNTIYTYDDFLNLSFKMLLPTDYYEATSSGGKWVDIRDNEEKMRALLDNAMEIRIVGIVMPEDNSVMSNAGGQIGYLPELTEYVIQKVNDSEIVKKQLADRDIDVFTGFPFEEREFDIDMVDLSGYEEFVSMTEKLLGKERLNQIVRQAVPTLQASSTYEDNLLKLGVCDLDMPMTIRIYPKNFEAKQQIQKCIEEYNKRMEAEGKEGSKITYNDYVGLLLSGVVDIVNAITYVLVAFVAISLVVSSIMIGVITYISVLERTKEIGILRALGASKRDISRVFNAETIIVGFTAGLIGILLSRLLIIPMNLIIEKYSEISNLAVLPTVSALILVAISMILTLIAGLIPSRFAAHRDPVIALRSE